MNKLTLFIVGIAILIFLLPVTQAQIALESFQASPEKISPGEDILLELHLKNVGEEDIEKVMVSLDLTQVPFAPSSSSNEKIIAEIDDQEEETLYFNIKTLPTAEPQVYKIPVIISHGTFSKTSLIGVEVEAPAKIDLLLDHSELVQVGEKGKFSLKFVNTGLTEIKVLKVTLRESPLYTIISPSTLYLGEVDVGDFETEEFTILPLVKNPLLALDLEYSNAARVPFAETKLLTLKVYTPEEAKQLGLTVEKESYTLFLTAGALLLLIFLIYKKFRKRKNAF